MDSTGPLVTPGISKLNFTDKANGDDVGQVQNPNLIGDNDKPLSYNPLVMNDILHVLMGFCDVSTLKAARLVCKLWNSEAIPKLYRKSYFTVPQNFYHRSKGEQKSAIRRLKKFLVTHRILLSNIQVRYRRDISTFTDFGQPGKNPCIGPFVKNLACADPNHLEPAFGLKHCLDIVKILNKKFYTECTSDNLTTVMTKFPPRIIKFTDFSMLMEQGGQQYLDKLCHLSMLKNVKIQKLLFGVVPYLNFSPEVWARISQILSSIMDNNMNDLESLQLRASEKYLRQTTIPEIPSLRILHLFVKSHLQYIQPRELSLPSDFQFSNNFSNLKEIKIIFELEDYHTRQADFWDSYFANQKPAPSLKKLTYCDFSCDLNLEPILRCFTQLEQIHLVNPGNFTSAAKSIFKYGKNLKILKLDLDAKALTSNASSFDSIFTGFSQSTIYIIQSSSDDWDVSDMRIKPSILDLSDLELLSIGIDGTGLINPTVYQMFSVAGKYAFSLMPNLKVKINVGECRHEQYVLDALTEVSELSNVTISVGSRAEVEWLYEN